MDTHNEAAEAAAREAQDQENKKDLEFLMKKFPDALSSYPGVELTGNKLYPNEQGVRDGGLEEDKEWLSFVYYEAKSEEGEKEPWYGAIDPATGQVIATGSELQHWFD
ncbi:MAG: hypothetical protein AAB413_04185 [Patescibacteria group bacterium]